MGGPIRNGHVRTVLIGLGIVEYKKLSWVIRDDDADLFAL